MLIVLLEMIFPGCGCASSPYEKLTSADETPPSVIAMLAHDRNVRSLAVMKKAWQQATGRSEPHDGNRGVGVGGGARAPRLRSSAKARRHQTRTEALTEKRLWLDAQGYFARQLQLRAMRVRAGAEERVPQPPQDVAHSLRALP